MDAWNELSYHGLAHDMTVIVVGLAEAVGITKPAPDDNWLIGRVDRFGSSLN